MNRSARTTVFIQKGLAACLWLVLAFGAGEVCAGPPHAPYDPYGLHVGGELGVTMFNHDQFEKQWTPAGRLYLTWWMPAAWMGKEFDRLGLKLSARTLQTNTSLGALADGVLDMREIGLSTILSIDLNRTEGDHAWANGWHAYVGLGATWYMPDFQIDENGTAGGLPSSNLVEGLTIIDYDSKLSSALGANIEVGVERQFSKGLTFGLVLSGGYVTFKVDRLYDHVVNNTRRSGEDPTYLNLFPVFFGMNLGYNF